jgi:GT2 family glycosyltransferase
VVLNYRNYRDTVECVRALEKLDYTNFEIAIVDNDSRNESEQVLRETFGTHTIIQAGANRGYAAGNNVGVRSVLERGSKYVVILNNDTLVKPDFLTRMTTFAASHPEAGLLGALIMREDGRPDRMSARRIPPLAEIFWNRGPGKWFGTHAGLQARAYYESFAEFDGPTEVEIVSGSCMLLRSQLLDEIGLFDEATFLFWEEFILAEKVRRASFKTFLLPDVRVTHKGGRSVKTIGTLASRAYLRSLNHYLKRYRGVGLIRRYLTLAGPALFFLPGVIKSLAGLRTRSA